MKRYILLAVTWAILLSYIIYLLARNNGNVNIWLWIMLGCLSVIPIAERLKIGNWFDFNKKENTQVENKDDKVKISNYNISLLSEESARAFAECMKSDTNSKYIKENSALEKAIAKKNDKITIDEKELLRVYFIDAADNAIFSLIPLLQAIYSTTITKRFCRFAEYKEMSLDILKLLDEVEKYAPDVYTFKNSKSTFSELLAPVRELVILRNDVESKKNEPPDVKKGRKLIDSTYKTTSYFLGMVSTGLSVLVNRSIVNNTSLKK